MVMISATSVAAKDWNGIFPLHSTRADVQRRFGLPKSTKTRLAVNNGYWIYFINQEEVHFVFDLGDVKCVTPITEGTILRIHVRPTIQPLVSSLNLDEKKFRKFDPWFGTARGRMGYINEEDGLLIETSEGKVSEIIYVPPGSERALCPDFYSNNLEGVLLPVICDLAFDSYGDIRFEDEKARLDNFAIQLQNYPNAHGFIVVYAGRKATVNQAQRRANRAKNYMVNVRGIESERLYAIDGGYQPQLEIKLIVAPPRAEPPQLAPSLDPSQIVPARNNAHKKRK